MFRAGSQHLESRCGVDRRGGSLAVAPARQLHDLLCRYLACRQRFTLRFRAILPKRS
jgi:hypothetical protein